jgi:hypothetical protein
MPDAIGKDRPETELECHLAGMRWVLQTGECRSGIGKTQLSAIERIIGVIGLACAVGGLCLLCVGGAGSVSLPKTEKNNLRSEGPSTKA